MGADRAFLPVPPSDIRDRDDLVVEITQFMPVSFYSACWVMFNPCTFNLFRLTNSVRAAGIVGCFVFAGFFALMLSLRDRFDADIKVKAMFTHYIGHGRAG